MNENQKGYSVTEVLTVALMIVWLAVGLRTILYGGDNDYNDPARIRPPCGTLEVKEEL